MSELLETCESAARAGARELLSWRGRFQDPRESARRSGDRCRSRFAGGDSRGNRGPFSRIICFVGEEKTSQVEVGDDDFVWLVDPLDGTTNYIHGYPCYAVSVAVARGRELLAGVIYDPLADEMLLCGAGYRRAVQRRRGCETSSVTSVGEALVAVSLPPRVGPDSPDLADFIRVVQVSQAVRRSGSAALNLAYVAHGRLDAFWATKIQPWDVAAGVLLVREAGGVVTGRGGGEFDIWSPHFRLRRGARPARRPAASPRAEQQSSGFLA